MKETQIVRRQKQIRTVCPRCGCLFFGSWHAEVINRRGMCVFCIKKEGKTGLRK